MCASILLRIEIIEVWGGGRVRKGWMAKKPWGREKLPKEKSEDLEDQLGRMDI